MQHLGQMSEPSLAETWEALARAGAVAFVDDTLGTVAVGGADRASWLNALLTCDVAQVSARTAAYGVAVTKLGRILADVWIVSAGERLLVGLPRDRVAVLREHFERYLVMEDATHDDASAAYAWLHLHGGGAAEAARGAAAAHGGFAGEHDATGLGGAVLVVAHDALGACLATLAAQPGVRVGDAAAWDALRVARKVPRFGVDFGTEHYPQEAGLEKRAVSFQKGCYLGQEVVCRLEMRGHVTRRLVALAVEGSEAPALASEIRDAEGHVVGAVSSATAAPASGEAIALGMVRYAVSDAGTALSVAGRSGRVLAS